MDSEPIKVRAIQPGFYPTPPKDGYKNIGDEFFISCEKHFSVNWMARLSPAVVAPKKIEHFTVEPAIPFPGEPLPVIPRQKRKYTRKQKVGE